MTDTDHDITYGRLEALVKQASVNTGFDIEHFYDNEKYYRDAYYNACEDAEVSYYWYNHHQPDEDFMTRFEYHIMGKDN